MEKQRSENRHNGIYVVLCYQRLLPQIKLLWSCNIKPDKIFQLKEIEADSKFEPGLCFIL